jgi:secreted PhoX family phosphatase
MQTRRSFIASGAAAVGAAALGLGARDALGLARSGGGYGPLVEDPNGLLDLPQGFRYRVVQSVEDTLSNGAPVPNHFDGMSAFSGPRGSTILVRNHELRAGDAGTTTAVVGENPYDPAGPAGTTGLVVTPYRRVVRSFVTSSGTLTNCAGGRTPWGTWVTCEEDRADGHGYCFEVDPAAPEDERSRTPIREMGFFSHEAMGLDPATGIAYLTEDDFRLPIPADPSVETPTESRSSFLFRYLPDDRSPRPGALGRGGRLQALGIDERPLFNVDLGRTADRFQVVWHDVNPEEPHDDALAKGAARFNRLEGAYFAGGAFWFDDTAGGEGRHGQIFRLRPSGDPAGGGIDTLELFLEGSSAAQMDSPDNVVVTPWGDLWFVEDGGGDQRVMGITPGGDVYEFARNRLIGASSGGATELAGPTFSPDGRTFFVNAWDPGHTFAIWGPFRPRGDARRLASTTPRHPFAPAISGELAEAAHRQGRSHAEAAALGALGVTLT